MMFKENMNGIKNVYRMLDLGFSVASFTLACYIAQHTRDIDIHFGWKDQVFYSIMILVIWGWVFNQTRDCYSYQRFVPIKNQIVKVIKGSIFSLMIFLGFSYITPLPKPGDYTMLYFAISNFSILIVANIFIGLIRNFYHKRGFDILHTIVIGSSKEVDLFLSNVSSSWGLSIDKLLILEKLINAKQFNIPYGHINSLKKTLDNRVVDLVIFTVSPDKITQINGYIEECLIRGIRVKIKCDLFPRMDQVRLKFTNTGYPMYAYEMTRMSPMGLFIKRFLDIIASIIGLILLSPLFLIVSILIRLESKGPAFFSQPRIGRNGRVFSMHKFRSMVCDAEEIKQRLQKENEMKGHMFKMEEDPRITFIGKIIRKTSIDELPQLFNVLKGDMSLVGTRPPVNEEVVCYKNWHRRRLSIKPGITGLWQVSGRSDIKDFDKVVNLDLQYIDNWSLSLDIKILFMTVWVVLIQKGAK